MAQIDSILPPPPAAHINEDICVECGVRWLDENDMYSFKCGHIIHRRCWNTRQECKECTETDSQFEARMDQYEAIIGHARQKAHAVRDVAEGERDGEKKRNQNRSLRQPHRHTVRAKGKSSRRMRQDAASTRDTESTSIDNTSRPPRAATALAGEVAASETWMHKAKAAIANTATATATSTPGQSRLQGTLAGAGGHNANPDAHGVNVAPRRFISVPVAAPREDAIKGDAGILGFDSFSKSQRDVTRRTVVMPAGTVSVGGGAPKSIVSTTVGRSVRVQPRDPNNGFDSFNEEKRKRVRQAGRRRPSGYTLQLL